MYQAGLKNITLYENKGIAFMFYDQNDLSLITDITSTGDVIAIENLQRPKLDIISEFAKSGKLYHSYKLEFLLLGLLQDNLLIIEQLTNSIYGWCALVEFYDGEKRFYPAQLFCKGSKINPSEEMSFKIELVSPVPSSKTFYNYLPDQSLNPVYRWDSTILSWDSGIYSFDCEL
jgi:hypothetical protein